MSRKGERRGEGKREMCEDEKRRVCVGVNEMGMRECGREMRKRRRQERETVKRKE